MPVHMSSSRTPGECDTLHLHGYAANHAMYLATITSQTKCIYQIRQSFYDPVSDCYSYRLVFDLGSEPTAHMELIGEHLVYFSNELLQAVGDAGQHDPDTVLERLLWDFLPPEMRERMSRFDRRGTKTPRKIDATERTKIEEQIHIFDRRRLYYLYYRAIDQAKLFSMREVVFRQLFDQSRDEREYHFAELEKRLEPDQYRNYLYAIFQLHHHFTASYASYLPEGLPEDLVADRFVEELCRLNSSPSFWKGDTVPQNLHPHLIRYLVMFFDFTPRNRLFENEFVRRFINSHRTFRWPERKPDISHDRILEIFDQSLEDLKKMSGKELTRLYRKKAMEFHPDQGGDHELFVELTEVYSMLQQKKKR